MAKSTTLRRPDLWLSFNSIVLNREISYFLWNAVNINVELETEFEKMYYWLTQI